MENQTETKTVDPLDNDQINQVARKFAMTAADITNYSKNMKAGGLARVLIAVMEFPFNGKPPRFKAKAEEELFLMCVGIQHYKGIMSAAIQKNEQLTKQIEDEAAAKVAEDLLTQQAKGGN